MQMPKLLTFGLFLTLLVCAGCPTVEVRDPMPLREGITLALVSEIEPGKAEKDEYLDRDVMFDTIQDHLSQSFRIVSLRDLEEARRAEAASLGTSAFDNPGAYQAARYNDVNVMVYVWVTSTRAQEPEGDFSWHATIGTRGVWRQTGEEVWKFQLRTGEDRPSGKPRAETVRSTIIGDREARSRAIKNLAQAVAEEIVERVQNRNQQILPENVYTLKFVGFTSSQKDKIEMAVVDLENKGYFKIQKGGGSAGPGHFTYNVKWLHTSNTQEEIAQLFEQACVSNQVTVSATYSTPGILTFQKKGH